MNKKYIVRLCDAEREVCLETIKKLKGSSENGKRSRGVLVLSRMANIIG